MTLPNPLVGLATLAAAARFPRRAPARRGCIAADRAPRFARSQRRATPIAVHNNPFTRIAAGRDAIVGAAGSGCAAANERSASGGYSRERSTVQATAREQHDRADVERVVNGVRDAAGCVRVIADAGARQQPRQHARDDRAHADEEALHRVAGRALRGRQLVADERAERLHRNIDRCVQDPQQPGGDPQRRRVRHQHERDRSKDRADQKIGPASSEPRPGAIRAVADDRLHDQPGERRRNPQQRNLLDARPSVWKMRLTLAFCNAKPNWMPRKPKHMFQICQNDSAGRAAAASGAVNEAATACIGARSGSSCQLNTYARAGPHEYVCVRLAS